MTDQLAIDFTRPTGRDLGEEGMRRTLEAEREDWIDHAIERLRQFAAFPGYREFKTEDFRWWLIAGGTKPPHNHHVWGALTNRACKAGVIRFTGKFLPSKSPATHGHPVKVWTAA